MQRTVNCSVGCRARWVAPWLRPVQTLPTMLASGDGNPWGNVAEPRIYTVDRAR